MEYSQILQKFNLQKQSLATSPFKDVNNRISALKKLKQNIKLMEEEICQALYKDLNKSPFESYMTEIGMTLSEISYMIAHTKRFSRPKRVGTPLAHFWSSSKVYPSPYGCVLVISPWNYPFMLSIEPIVDAISAGNSVILKPSEISPNVSAVLEKLIKATFDEAQVAVVQGDKEECTFLLEQDFDYIFYTGSTRVGKIVMQHAAEHFTPVTLEMGGKSPCIVDSTADLKLSAKRIIFGKLLNCGQTCVAPDFVYCDKTIKDELIKELERQIVLQYSVDPLSNKEYPKMVNKKQFDNMLSLVVPQEVVFGGKSNAQTLKIEPTILQSTFDSPAMEEEIFGPILPIVTFDNLDEAIDKLNSLPHPLALYIFSNNRKNQQKVLKNFVFGGGCVNDTIVHIANPKLGFGGVGTSGMGAYHGKVGFMTFSHYKSVLKKANFVDLPMRYQKSSKFKQKLIKMFLR